MKNNKLVIGGLVITITIIAVIAAVSYRNKVNKPTNTTVEIVKNTVSKQDSKKNEQYAGDPSLVGPGGNVPASAPSKKDFKLFAVPVPGVLSRSGQPTIANFQWLKDNGWKSVVDLRVDGEKGDISLDTKIPGFNQLGLNFLSLPIADGTTPSDSQVDDFLNYVTNPANQPVNVHCAAGIGRTGIMVALYRYSVQGWPIDKAIQESSLFTKSINKSQQGWLRKWANAHKPGDYAKK